MINEMLLEEVKDTIETTYPNLVYSVKTRMPYPADVVKRMQLRYPNFPDMSKAEYESHIRQTEISTEELMLISAMQVSIALEILKDKLAGIDWQDVRKSYYWINTWEKDGFKGYYDAKKHLEKVDSHYLQKYKCHYDLWYIDRANQVELLNWSEEIVDRTLKKYSQKEKLKPKKKSIIPDY
jgi:hypothetical protein